MDPLSEILSSLTLRHTAVGTMSLSAPWGFEVDHFEAPTVYGVTSGGPCWLCVPGQPDLMLAPGDIVLLVNTDRHRLLSSPDTPAESMLEAWQANRLPVFGQHGEPDTPLHLVWGGGGAGTTLLGVAYEMFGGRGHPLLAALPPMIVWRRSQGGAFPWMRPAVDFLLAKEAGSPGFTATARLLAELVFVSLVRTYLLQAPSEARGWLRGLTDPAIAAALQAMHAEPAADWTVALLARRAGLSRTIFSMRFTALVDVSPIEYLTRWRMHLAAERIARERPNLTQLAFDLGYASDAAFRSAFKRYYGVPPSKYLVEEIG